ncbi:MAG TPA: serine hydrolase [Longimicrobiales bacterium]|nr:serine hydrolase [Longimicrobiales bacterium]
MAESSLRSRVGAIAAQAGASSVAVALYDYAHHTGWSLNADRWFHAASTIKVPVLLGVFDAIERGELAPHARVHVRNRFLSLVDRQPYRVDSGRDANGAVHAALGRMLTVRELALHMIATSSNLATNLLVDVVGVTAIRATLQRLELSGIEFHRGVEDIAAWQAGINNLVTASGLLSALRRIAERRAISDSASEHMLEILHAQEFRRGIPAGLPEGARVAHKTGEMSRAAHDAGIVYLPDREPYVVVILTEWDADVTGRLGAIAEISRAAYEHVTREESIDA